jgi:hypothetical protein
MSAGKPSDPASGSALSREQILRALQSLSDQLGQQGITGEVCLFGGTVMVLAFTARLTTKDVDAIFQPSQVIRQLARRIAEDLHLPDDWLNDGVKGFVSTRHETTTGNLPQFPHLRLTSIWWKVCSRRARYEAQNSGGSRATRSRRRFLRPLSGELPG